MEATPRTIQQSTQPKAKLFGISRIGWWEIGGIFFINVLGGALHFAFELSSYNRVVALFASVNESTWEHLKFYFWASVLWSLIEYTYIRDEANNFTFAKAMNLLLTPLVVSICFYAYLGVALPKFGQGFFVADITTGVIGVIVGQITSSLIMQRAPLGKAFKRYGIAIWVTLLLAFSTLTYFPPKFFLFEDFWGYEYNGQYGILEDYEPYKIFTTD